MARFYGCNLSQKPQVDRTVLQWLTGLNDSFSVFVEVEGSDFSLDFLVLKPTGIFDIEAKNWNVRYARCDADWVLSDGAVRPNPFLNQVIDQCTKVHDYLLVQREEVLGKEKAALFHDHRLDIKIFPVVAISYAGFSGDIQIHRWRKIFAAQSRLLPHLRNFEWFYDKKPKPFAFSHTDIERLAELLHLERIDPTTQKPLSGKVVTNVSRAGEKTPPLASIATKSSVLTNSIDDSTTNPYQYTYTVTGDSFYGREMELRRIRRALDSGHPIAIMGLQRAGKSSLAKESIRRYTENSPQYAVIDYDFRRLKDEALQQEEDLTLQFVRSMQESREDGSEANLGIASPAMRMTLVDQRQMFRAMLRSRRTRNKRTILFLDECQEIEDFLGEEKYRTFFAHLDALCRERDLALSVVIACRPSFFEFGVIRNYNLGRLFETIWLGALEEEPAVAVVNRAAPWLQIEADAAERVRFLTGNHAFWLQFLCHRLFEDCVLSGSSVLQRNSVDRIFQKILTDVGCKAQFYLLFQDIENNPTAFTLLKKIAEVANAEGMAVDVASLIPDYRERRDIADALRILQDNQIIVLNDDFTHPTAKFQVEALRCWLRCHLLTL